MDVTFTRTGERRYGVSAGELAMHPAPGYDDEIPHDLVHLAVELACGIPMGVYGQLAYRVTIACKRGEQPASDPEVERACALLGDLSARWRTLKVGESMTVPWVPTHPR